MCLYPKLIINPKYKPNKKNGHNPPEPKDKRIMYVPIGCGKCIECRKQKARQWQVRLHEEIKTDTSGKFVTLTFSNESLEKLCTELEKKESNYIATIAVRRFLERWRKKYKKSIKHWLITELGHQGTERIHLHGIIFTNENNETIEEIWKYGQIWVGDYVNSKTINYIIKYCTKIDIDHKGYEPTILCSAGIGRNYLKTFNAQQNKYLGKNTKDYYKLPNGAKTQQPIYYRNHIYTEEQREELWIHKLDKNERFVMGTKVSIANGEEEYLEMLKNAQETNKRLGYGDDSKEWSKKDYNVTLNAIKKEKKLKDYLQNKKK